MNGVFLFLADFGEHGKTSHLNANYCENEIAYKEAEQERNVEENLSLQGTRLSFFFFFIFVFFVSISVFMYAYILSCCLHI